MQTAAQLRAWQPTAGSAQRQQQRQRLAAAPRRSAVRVAATASSGADLHLFSPCKVGSRRCSARPAPGRTCSHICRRALCRRPLSRRRRRRRSPPPQINLFLRVVRRREDGYHDLASLFHVIDLGDDMAFEALAGTAAADALTCNMVGVPTDGSNLVIKVTD